MDKKKSGKNLKKGRKGKRSKKKVNADISPEDAALNEKKELVAALVSKTGKSEDEVLAAYDKFHEENPSGEISQQLFLETSKVL